MRLARAAASLQALSPLSVLERGYAVVRHEGEVVTRARQLDVGDVVDIRLRQGRVVAAVTKTEDAPETES
jgi:exodeoxyribonuclease VII large subunit